MVYVVTGAAGFIGSTLSERLLADGWMVRGVDAFTPYLAEYDATEAGKTAHYMLRWHMRDGTNGAWGETVSATITG